MTNTEHQNAIPPETKLWCGRFVQLLKTGCGLTLLLNRPDRANAYDRTMLNEIETAIDVASATAGIHALVIRSSTLNYFCAGADLTEIASRTADDVLELQSQRIFDRIASLPQVTVAAVSGAAAGGGLELALACDIRLCSANGTFLLPETRLGLIPAAGGIWRLPLIAGRSLANEMILAGRVLCAEEALRHGLVSRVTSNENFDQSISELLEAICTRDPLANSIAKRILARAGAPADPLLDKLAQAFLTAQKEKHTTKSTANAGGQK